MRVARIAKYLPTNVVSSFSTIRRTTMSASAIATGGKGLGSSRAPIAIDPRPREHRLRPLSVFASTLGACASRRAVGRRPAPWRGTPLCKICEHDVGIEPLAGTLLRGRGHRAFRARPTPRAREGVAVRRRCPPAVADQLESSTSNSCSRSVALTETQSHMRSEAGHFRPIMKLWLPPSHTSSSTR